MRSNTITLAFLLRKVYKEEKLNGGRPVRGCCNNPGRTQAGRSRDNEKQLALGYIFKDALEGFANEVMEVRRRKKIQEEF